MADLNQIAHRIIRESTQPRESEPQSPAQESGRKAQKLSAEQRSEIVRKAARARWDKEHAHSLPTGNGGPTYGG